MTELQTSLIAIGGVIVIAVISYNKWHEYKAKKTVERAFSSEHDDVLMTPGSGRAPEPESARQEPVFSGEQPGVEMHDRTPAAATDHAMDAEVLVQTTRKLDGPVDELVDCMIPLALAGPVRGEKVIPVLQSLRHIGNKPVHFLGQLADGAWETVAHGGIYSALMAGVQLANRGSALNELEYSDLVMRLRRIADDLDAEPDVPDMTSVMISARALHQFITEYDAQLSVSVLSKGAPWAVSTLLAALERQGFDLRPDGRLIMPDGDGGILFTLSTNVTLADETTSRLTLLLDVPCAPPLRDGFGAMIACAKMLAARLDGMIVDDGNQHLSEEALGGIGGQVKAFYSDMEAADIPAGSTRALRLFS